MTDKEILEMCSEMVFVLEKCREGIFAKFDKFGYDAAMFDIDIDLSVKVDHIVIRIKEQWDALSVTILDGQIGRW